MKISDPSFVPLARKGFTLPSILVVVGALLILAIGALLVVGIERSTARSFVDRQRAELAAKAGLEDVRGIFAADAANDDFVILQGTEPGASAASTKEKSPYLYLARGSGGELALAYRYSPLFSTATLPAGDSVLKAPDPKTLVGSEVKEMSPVPWFDPAKVAWKEVTNDKDKVVSRYAFWTEDLQGKLNPKVAGNIEGTAGAPARVAYPLPATKPLNGDGPALRSIAVHVLDPAAKEKTSSPLTGKLIEGRPAMLSPESALGAANFAPPLKRSTKTGLLEDPLAAAVERNFNAAPMSYREQPLVPFAPGISKNAAGKPKLNLNELLDKGRGGAIDEFADWVDKAVPPFVDRKGGFPDDYLRTLAANTFDYADTDNDPTISNNVYRGLDGFPVLSEVALKVEYLGYRASGGRLLLNWRFKLFGEMWNMSNKPVSGDANLSYEVALNPTAIESGTRGKPFDDPALLNDKTKSGHDLTFKNGRFYGPAVSIALAPDQYKFYKFAQVQCSIDVGPNNVSYNTKFQLEEKSSEARGVSVLWNDVETERTNFMVRDLGPPGREYMRFTILYPKTVGKAGIPGAGYGPHGEFTNNMGDPRMANYFRVKRLSENSLSNLSPNRRNIRRGTIYDSDSSTKPKHFGRVLPSEWPDGGQNASIPNYPVPSQSDFAVEPTEDSVYANNSPTFAAEAPFRLSNIGRFYSAADLGNVYDPVMWFPTYADIKGSAGSGKRDTETLKGNDVIKPALMPPSRNAWPEVSSASAVSADHGGGNTLRIGRPEHQKFELNGQHAGYLLDLFHAGDPIDVAGEGAKSKSVLMEGRVNVNTAGKDVLRAMAAGAIGQDPELRKVTSWNHDVASGRFSPQSEKLALGSPTRDLAADLIAEGIIHSRPFSSMKDLAAAKGADDRPVFGNKLLYPEADRIQWTDAAAEEIFARVHDAATLRSRNFRVWVIGQSINKIGTNVEVLAESRKAFTVFVDPGARKADGSIDPAKAKTRVTYENDF